MGNVIVIVVTLVVFALSMVVLNKVFANQKAKHTRKSLQDISRGEEFEIAAGATLVDDADQFGESLRNTPLLGNIFIRLKRSGSEFNMMTYLVILISLIFIITALITYYSKNVAVALVLGIVATYIINNIYLGIKLDKRNQLFLNDFPDAIDMIVRSVRSGHPLLASLGLISQNSRPPLATEFQRVVDEVSYGRPLGDSLRKMADRIGILDVNFFVVILSVQQETGGSMAEVLSNLSTIIRKRKHLNLKIRAMTSEGRITTWIFSGIPLLVMGVLLYVAPNYLDPFTQTRTGEICGLASLVLIVIAIYISRQLCKMDI